MENIISEVIELYNTINKSEFIDISDIPNIDLYMDQVTTFIEDRLTHTKRFSEDKILTKTMINNYAKAKLFPPPIKKKYSKNHIMLLVIIYNLKFMLSINDINKLLKPITNEIRPNETSKVLEQLYENFVIMQKSVKDNFFLDKNELDFTEKLEFSEFNTREDIKYILVVLYLAIKSNIQKKLAEKILDDKFK